MTCYSTSTRESERLLTSDYGSVDGFVQISTGNEVWTVGVESIWAYTRQYSEQNYKNMRNNETQLHWQNS